MVKQLILSLLGFIAGILKFDEKRKTKQQKSKDKKRKIETEVFGSVGALWQFLCVIVRYCHLPTLHSVREK
jgi:hypothetical protein